jgi:formylglycine-generating enzyme required for sulfatase activity
MSLDPADIPALVALPAGEFMMGESANDRFANDTERPAHRVRIAAGLVFGVFPVTVAQYRCFRPDHAPGDDGDLPVVGVSWVEAREYGAWLATRTDRAFRLPTEAEWEYACRAGTTTPFYCGNQLTPAEANFYYDEQGHRVGPGRRTKVGTYAANAFGLHDLHGNVCEWTADAWHPNYLGAPADGSLWIDGKDPARRVIRGGGWDYLPRLLRSSWRDGLAQEQHRDNVGFRMAANETPN